MSKTTFITNYFLSRIHDRKLCVIGMCTLMSLQDAKPQVLSEVADKIIPSLILIFDGLKRAYAARAAEEEEDESEDDDDDCEGESRSFSYRISQLIPKLITEGISSDEDEIDELGNSYFERVSELAKAKGAAEGFEISAEVKVRFRLLSLLSFN